MNHISPRTYEVVKFVCNEGSVTQRDVRTALSLNNAMSTLNRAVIYGLLTRRIERGLAVYGPTVAAAKFLAEFMVGRLDVIIPRAAPALTKRPPASVWEYCGGV